ncbi:MAG: biotin--[acetyl-CoA-carboxylase] ligase [Mycobacterium sp.]|nr:biotin--[acetyl-CoA-carboxylase] ligase [Mycobacterium sp.]
MTMTTDDRNAALDQSALNEVRGPWRRIEVVAETGSTNADLIARAATEDVDGLVLIAEHQTAGRGRNGRSWSAVPGTQVTMSVGIRADTIPNEAWGWIPLVAGLAVVDAIETTTDVIAGLKWPNDVLARPPARGKLAGILAEVAAPAATIVVGIGLNVSLQADELPDPAATSLVILGGRSPNRAAVIEALLDELGRRIAGLRTSRGADATLVDEYRARSLTIGSRVRAMLPGGRNVVGMAVAIDDQGRLRIDTEDGPVVVSAGDIVHLRPVDDDGSG